MTTAFTLREALARVIDSHSLSTEEMTWVVGEIMEGRVTPAQIGALLTALRMKGETVDEVVGAALAMRKRMQVVPTQESVLLDTCGTGGDGSGSVNVSTLASILVAACGVKVAKHGNRALSSRSGSHDVIEALGIHPSPGPEAAADCLAKAGICFLYAPSYHTATKHAAGPRRELGFRTLWNLLGPLTNPAQATYHINGVFSRDRCEFLARALGQLGSKRAMVVHGEGGLDEFAPRGKTFVAELRDGKVSMYETTPKEFGLEEEDPEGLLGGEPAQNATLFMETLRGRPGAGRSAALMTAAAGLVVVGKVADLRAGAALAIHALDSGNARTLIETLQRISPVQGNS